MRPWGWRDYPVAYAQRHLVTPLLIACLGGHTPVVKFLLDRGANIWHCELVSAQVSMCVYTFLDSIGDARVSRIWQRTDHVSPLALSIHYAVRSKSLEVQPLVQK